MCTLGRVYSSVILLKSRIELGKEKVLSEKLGLDRCDLYSGAIVLDRRWLRSLQPRIHFPTALLHGGLHCWEGGSKPQRYIYISISWGAGSARRLPYIYFDYNSHPHQALTRNWLGQPSFKYKMCREAKSKSFWECWDIIHFKIQFCMWVPTSSPWLFAEQIVNNLLGKEQSSSFFPLADENVILPPYTAAADENIIPAVPGVSTALCSQKEQRSTLLHCVCQSLGPHLQIRQDRGRDDLASGGGDMNIAWKHMLPWWQNALNNE